MIGAVAFVVGVAALQVQAALPPPAPLFALTVAVLTLAGLLLRRSLTSVPFAHPVLAGPVASAAAPANASRTTDWNCA